MQRGDRPSLNASNEYAASIILMLLDKITWSLLGGNSDEGNTFVCRFKPDNLRLVWLSVLLLSTRATITVLTFSFLLLLRSLTTRSEQSKRAIVWSASSSHICVKCCHKPREHLSSHTLDDGNNVTSIQWLLLVIYLFFLH